MATQFKSLNQKQEFQLWSRNGRPVISYENEARAKEEAADRGLRIVRVTTIQEELTNDALCTEHAAQS